MKITQFLFKKKKEAICTKSAAELVLKGTLVASIQPSVLATSQVNLSSVVSDQVRLKQVCSASEAS